MFGSDPYQELFDVISQHERIVLSHEHKLKIRHENQTIDTKPNGLWYSCGDSWLKYILSEIPSFMERYNYIHSIKIGSNILKISNLTEFDAFNRQYSVEGTAGITLIDWPKVAENYDGIEINPYQWNRRNHPDSFWYYGWDVASGCIWNPAGMSSSTKLIKINKTDF